MNQVKCIEFEDILEDVGGYGWYQKRLVYFFLVPLTLFGSMLSMNTMFMLSAPSHSCKDSRIGYLPVDQESIKLNYSIDQCFIDSYDINGTTTNITTDMMKCSSWAYDKSNYDETAVTYVSNINFI